jgi:hypothetical protein
MGHVLGTQAFPAAVALAVSATVDEEGRAKKEEEEWR